jgi:uncharacterized phage infection (PIP) family protein YhgE
MAKKDLIMQELKEVKSILENKTYSQLLVKYHARLFSDINGLTEEEGLAKEDIDEIKGKLDEIATQLEEVTDQQVVEVSDEPATEEPATEQPAEETPAEETPATEEPATEETPAEEPATEEPATEEAPAEEQPTEEPATEQPAEDKDAETLAKIENLDEDLDALKSTVESKEFSKTTARIAARLYSRCYDEVEKLDEDQVENLEEIKEMMEELADKIEEVANAEDETPAEKPAKEETPAEETEEKKEESEKKYALYIDGVLTATGTMQEMADAKAELDSDVKTRAEVCEFSDSDCYEIFDKATGRATADHGTYDEMSDRLREHEDSSAYGIRKCTKCNTEGAPEAPANEPAAEETEELPVAPLMLGVDEEPIALTQEPQEEPRVEVEPLEFITGEEEIIDSSVATPVEERDEEPMTFDDNLMLEDTLNDATHEEGAGSDYINDLDLEGEPVPVDDLLD